MDGHGNNISMSLYPSPSRTLKDFPIVDFFFFNILISTNSIRILEVRQSPGT